MPQKFQINPILEQVQSLGNFGKRFELNTATGKFFSDPWLTKPEFAGTPLGDVLDSLGPIGQARLLCLESGESYTAHVDPDDRIHLAIVTNPYSFLVDVDSRQMYHLPANGELWYMDTGRVHVAANWGGRTRIHLNIRTLLPNFDPALPALRFFIADSEVDWKQVSYNAMMSLIHRGLRNGQVQGFEGLSDKEMLVNTVAVDQFFAAAEEINRQGVNMTVTRL